MKSAIGKMASITNHQLIEKYHGRCGRCLIRTADGVHEIVPRSAGGKCTEPNQIPLCAACHTLVQDDWQTYQDELYRAQARANQMFGNIACGGNDVVG